MRRKAQFIVLDFHPETLRHHLSMLPVPLPYGACLQFSLDLIKVFRRCISTYTMLLRNESSCSVTLSGVSCGSPLRGCVLSSLSQAVAHMQLHRTVHLDLKPDNILVATDGRVILCDFGTAMQFDSSDMITPYTQVRCHAA